ncbi:MAG TPA: apolipoprotein N-acyltransferase, partial [Fibrobacteraceae bacterium]|nr:apolipoprotein N-acyltransferase [Fibrobacteraceae bacterium]
MLARMRSHPSLAFVAAQWVAFALLQFPIPTERLSFEPAELLYAILAIAFLFFTPLRGWWRRWLSLLILTQSLFVVLHYQFRDETLSLVSFFLALIPAFLWGLITLMRWSLRHLRDPQSRQALWPSLISWGFFALAYPPLPLGPAALVLLAPWFLTLLRHNTDRALFATFWSGILFHSMSYYWIFNVAKVGPPPAIIGGLFLLISYFSFFFVLGAWIFLQLRRYSVAGVSLIWIFPFVWAGIEIIRSYGQISFPWGHLGYVFGNHVELIQGLAWIGVYGYTILLLYSNMILAYALKTHHRWLIPIPLCILFLLLGQGSWTLRQHPDLPAKGASMRIALVQPSISQTRKWSKSYFDSVMRKTWTLMDTLHADSLDLIVLPETAMPDFLTLRPHEEEQFRSFSRQHQIAVVLGALNFDRKGPAPRKYNFYNSAFIFWPSGVRKEFRKTRLVPFSETLPFSNLLPILNYVDLGEGDFSPGKNLPVFGAQQWTPNICYESTYPDIMRTMVANGTRLVVNITNDGWFGRTTAPGQHANLIRYRAVESGLPVARCANSGISLFYDPHGRIFEATSLFDPRIVYHRLPLRSSVTFYDQYGD